MSCVRVWSQVHLVLASSLEEFQPIRVLLGATRGLRIISRCREGDDWLLFDLVVESSSRTYFVLCSLVGGSAGVLCTNDSISVSHRVILGVVCLQGDGFLFRGVLRADLDLASVELVGRKSLLLSDIVEAPIFFAVGIEVWSRVVVVGNIRRLHRSIV